METRDGLCGEIALQMSETHVNVITISPMTEIYDECNQSLFQNGSYERELVKIPLLSPCYSLV